jgi:hypothetical protein
LVAIAIALAVGWWVAGPLVYKTAIGLSETAFPAGERLQDLLDRVAPDFALAGPGLALVAIISVVVGAVAFLLVRAARRARVGSTDPSRRRFVTGLGFGTVAALVSTALVARVSAWRAAGSAWVAGGAAGSRSSRRSSVTMS